MRIQLIKNIKVDAIKSWYKVYRYITEIIKDNIQYCMEMIKLTGIQMDIK